MKMRTRGSSPRETAFVELVQDLALRAVQQLRA